jgi:TonB-linked SusC/RagA family outer membrane protein
VAVGNLSSDDVLENRIMNSFTLNYNIAPWVRFMQVVSLQYINEKRKRFLPHNAIGADWLDPQNNEIREINASTSEIITRSQLFLTPRLGEAHLLSGMLMLETDQIENEYSNIIVRNGPSTTIQDPASNPPVQYMASGSAQTHIIGFLANLNYKLRDRYMTSLNLRADASSRFGSNNRWGTFPSISIGWRFSEEPWMQGLSFLTDSKFRYSYGYAGKQPGGSYDRHAIFNTVNPSQYMDEPIVVPRQVQLANLKWQTLTQSNFGLDLSFFNRIDITGEIYTKITEDLLWRNYKIPYESGFSTLKWFNGGKLKNKGWELSLSVLALRREQTIMSFNFNIAHNINTFIAFPENFNREVDLNIGNGQYPRRADIGQPVGSFYGFRYLGVWPSTEDVVSLTKTGDVLSDVDGNPVPLTYKGTYRFQGGDAIYEDVNHDGQIDLQDVVYLGDSNPDFIGGFGGYIEWKNFRISSQFHYRLGYEIVNEIALKTEGMLDKNNQSKAVLHRWRTKGHDEPGMLPRAYIYHPANNLGSSRYVEAGEFLRLVNLTISYKLPRSFTERLRIRSLDLAVTMRRIFTLTRYSGQDPEVPQDIDDPFWFGTDKARTPPPKAFTFSMSLGF